MIQGLHQIQLVQLFLNQLVCDKDAPIGDIHESLMKVCYISNTTPFCAILQGVQRGTHGPVTALNRLIAQAQEEGMCLWHGRLCEERTTWLGSTEYKTFCPVCDKCPV